MALNRAKPDFGHATYMEGAIFLLTSSRTTDNVELEVEHGYMAGCEHVVIAAPWRYVLLNV